jgi:hypothetical protein
MGTDQSTISRVITALEQPIAKAVKEFVRTSVACGGVAAHGLDK